MSANESFPRPWRVERNPKNGLQNIVVTANGRLVAEPLPIDGATAEDCEAVAAEIAGAAAAPASAPEPLAAILRDIEADAEAAWEGTPLRRALASYGARLREALDAPALAPGNAAAMSEALKESTALLAVVRGDEYAENITRQIDRNTDVLSAPARNCDRYATLDEARKAFQEARGHKVLADVELWDSMDEAGALVRWLFAPAEGRNKQ